MDIVLIPGFWLDGDSWSTVTPPLAVAGHRVHPLTLPGKEAEAIAHAGIGLRTHIDAVVVTIDELAAAGSVPVALVGHSGGAAIAWGAADARPDLVGRLVFVDAIPSGEGSVVNDELPVEGDSVPLPAWHVFEAADLADLDDERRAQFAAIAVPEPAGVARDPLHLTNEARFRIPVTIIACEFPREMVEGSIASGAAWAGELARIESLEIVELPTGHWPQLTRPVDLGESILAAVGPA
ncbi:alpha/beta hydrolase [Microcella alkalica]|uniref:Pimeloyl-ACP methyl ester carboxylesterase n=1 Tax=Microcella alkalica TaxID=355930 RepID=A0A839EC70_9MICO|nr:alpha/beta hydrolase [Microcella alkalica]MBA8848042.1 pimeloyl-ACP methyl ester carboxylesterase [Microcella alkalica]